MYTIKLITGKEITLSDTPNKSQLVALFEACKQARPDLFEEAQPEPAPVIPSEILQALCYYDPRNPNREEIEEPANPEKPCFCDNCFYSRTKLAQMYINLATTTF